MQTVIEDFGFEVVVSERQRKVEELQTHVSWHVVMLVQRYVVTRLPSKRKHRDSVRRTLEIVDYLGVMHGRLQIEYLQNYNLMKQ